MAKPPRPLLVGRDRELEALAALIEGGAPCIAIVGLAGMGKSAVARSLARRFTGDEDLGFVQLSHCDAARDEADLVRLIGRDVGVRNLPRRSEIMTPEALDDLSRQTAMRLSQLGPSLLFLDGVVTPALLAPHLDRWLDGAPDVHWVVTSRERLWLSRETFVPLGPLRTTAPPSTEAITTTMGLGRAEDHVEEPRDPPTDALSPSARLFLQAARRYRADFEVAKADVEALEALVRHLEGVPLSIEQAAAGVRFFGTADILERLIARSTSSKDDPVTRGIRASLELLQPIEHRALMALSTFASLFTVEAAEAVLRACVPENEPLELLSLLEGKALLEVQSTDETKLGLLRVLRELLATLPTDEVVDRVARTAQLRHYRRVLLELVQGPHELLRSIRAEEANLSACLRFLLEHPDTLSPYEGASFLRALATTFERWSPASAIDVIHRGLEMPVPDDLAEDERMKVTSERDWLRTHPWVVQGFAKSELAALGAAKERAIAAGEEVLLLRLAVLEARSLINRGELDEGLAALEALLPRLRRNGGAVWETHRAEVLIGTAKLDLGHLDEARALFEPLTNERDDRLRGHAHGQLALVELDIGEFDRARLSAERALSAYGLSGDATNQSLALTDLALTYLAQGLPKIARDVQAQALAIDGPPGVLSAYRYALMATILARTGDVTAARRTLAEAKRLAGEDPARHGALLIALGEAAIDLAEDASHAIEVRRRLSALREEASRTVVTRILCRVLGEWANGALAQHAVLHIARDGSSVRPSGSRREPIASRAAQRILLHLVARHEEGAPPTKSDGLIAAGWPGERISMLAAKNRLYVAMNALRAAGLRGWIETTTLGYRLSPEATFAWDETPSVAPPSNDTN